ncbi:phosphatidylinositol 3,4,5-trisphosphate 5-phosphatase 2-like, partial [Meleagris gallopavo]|uniref:phosphatidylinositol 3,4,5-trisphosphate 5-phosphatase 2-like n=1 Tax=Meleagris gallopavo TaxID=9103 RepID=UPI00093DC256
WGQVVDGLGTDLGTGWGQAVGQITLCPAGCTDDITTSDHSPVFGSFEVGVTSQFVSKKGLSKSSDQAYIEFESIEAIVKTASRTKFFIEFYSTCLEEFKKSCENDTQSSDNINFLKVQWSSRQLPTLKPILSEIEYLQDQHLLLTVKSLDGYESYGASAAALPVPCQPPRVGRPPV